LRLGCPYFADAIPELSKFSIVSPELCPRNYPRPRNYELAGEVEVDESYFGGVRKGKRGRGAAGKVAVFGLLKRGG
jgi:hypothetical protein